MKVLVFVEAIDQVLDAGRSGAGGSVVLGMDANYNLAREICRGLGSYGSNSTPIWTFVWQTMSRRVGEGLAKQVDFTFTRSDSALAASAAAAGLSASWPCTNRNQIVAPGSTVVHLQSRVVSKHLEY